jgi:hypothetical protein
MACFNNVNIGAKFTSSRHLIQFMRSGQHTIEAPVTTPDFQELKAGDRFNVLSSWHGHKGTLELVCKQQCLLIATVRIARIVGAGTMENSRRRDTIDGVGAGDQGEDDGKNDILLGGWTTSYATERQGVFAFHLKVLEDMSM